jgi:eukaryotic-like serine/threonine-protein kinase
MTTNNKVGDTFFRDMVKAAARDIANLIIPGSAITSVLLEHLVVAISKAGWNWLQGKPLLQQQQAIDNLAFTNIATARAIAEEILEPYTSNPDVKAVSVNFISAIPMTARRAISRPNDNGNPTTLLSQLPRNSEDMLRFLPLRPPHFQPGDDVLDHQYRLEILLGQGGFAEVWKAQHLSEKAKPPVALKFCLDKNLLVSLKMESKIFEILKDNLHAEDYVQLLDTAYTADPPFLVYEYVDGGDLGGWLKSFDGKVLIRDVVRVMTMSARALAFAHKHGVVHRDLKPANLLFTREGRIKIADFGIGAIMADTEEQQKRSRHVTSATILRSAYTPLYTDLTQPLGMAANPKTDVYALGVIAYQLLTGDVARQIGPAWRADLQQKNIPNELIDVIGECVNIYEKRLPDADALLKQLNKLNLKQSNKPKDTPSPRDKFCTNCGKKVDTKFCINCGFCQN